MCGVLGCMIRVSVRSCGHEAVSHVHLQAPEAEPLDGNVIDLVAHDTVEGAVHSGQNS